MSHVYLHNLIYSGTSCPVCHFWPYSACFSAHTTLHCAWCCFGSFSLACMTDRMPCTNIMLGTVKISVSAPADLSCFLCDSPLTWTHSCTKLVPVLPRCGLQSALSWNAALCMCVAQRVQTGRHCRRALLLIRSGLNTSPHSAVCQCERR